MKVHFDPFWRGCAKVLQLCLLSNIPLFHAHEGTENIIKSYMTKVYYINFVTCSAFKKERLVFHFIHGQKRENITERIGYEGWKKKSI